MIEVAEALTSTGAGGRNVSNLVLLQLCLARRAVWPDAAFLI